MKGGLEMQYYVSFTIFIDSDIAETESEIKEMIIDQLDSTGVSVENVKVESIKHI